MTKTDDPIGRMGVFKRLKEVPDRYRLSQYEAAYDGRDVWTEFVETLPFNSERYQRRVAKAGRSWTEHMTGYERHHALAQPGDVESWCETLRTDRTVGGVYREYWVRIEQFYTWLQYHTEHPHVYHPVLIAASEYPTAGNIWHCKLEQRSHRRNRTHD